MRRIREADIKVLEAVYKFWREKYHAPTFREIAAETGLKSPAHIGYSLRKLSDLSLIKIVDRRVVPMFVIEAIESVIALPETSSHVGTIVPEPEEPAPASSENTPSTGEEQTSQNDIDNTG